MSTQSETTSRHDWQDYLPWLVIFRSVRPAISSRLLVLSAIGLIGMVAGWRICWNVLAHETAEHGRIVSADEFGRRAPSWPWEVDQMVSGGEGPLEGVADVPHVVEVLVATASQLTMPFQMLFRQELSYRGLAYALLCCAWALVVWAFFGGIMTRTVAMKLTRDEAVSWSRATQFTRARFGSYFAAPVLPLLGVFALTAPLALLGLIAQADIGVFLAGLVWPLAQLAGLLMTILLLGLLFGWPLMWATISTEGTDAFDAISRAYAYVFQRPFHYLFYLVIAASVGALGWILVTNVAVLVNHCALWAASWGASSSRVDQIIKINLESEIGKNGAALIVFWQHVVTTLAAAFGVSYLWSASTSIYLLLRRQVDAVEMDEAFIEDDDQQFGMPALETDAAGVPGVEDEE